MHAHEILRRRRPAPGAARRRSGPTRQLGHDRRVRGLDIGIRRRVIMWCRPGRAGTIVSSATNATRTRNAIMADLGDALADGDVLAVGREAQRQNLADGAGLDGFGVGAVEEAHALIVETQEAEVGPARREHVLPRNPVLVRDRHQLHACARRGGRCETVDVHHAQPGAVEARAARRRGRRRPRPTRPAARPRRWRRRRPASRRRGARRGGRRRRRGCPGHARAPAAPPPR